MSKIGFSDHAVERFIARHAPEMSVADARALLEARADGAAPLRRKSLPGHAMWKLTEPDITIVTKYDRKLGLDVCVTVLADGMSDTTSAVSFDAMPYDETDEEVHESVMRMIERDRAEEQVDRRPRSESKAPSPEPAVPSSKLAMKTELHNLRAQYEALERKQKRRENHWQSIVEAQKNLRAEIGRKQEAIKVLLLYLVTQHDPVAMQAIESAIVAEPALAKLWKHVQHIVREGQR